MGDRLGLLGAVYTRTCVQRCCVVGLREPRISDGSSDWPRVGRKWTSMGVGAVSTRRDPRKFTMWRDSTIVYNKNFKHSGHYIDWTGYSRSVWWHMVIACYSSFAYFPHWNIVLEKGAVAVFWLGLQNWCGITRAFYEWTRQPRPPLWRVQKELALLFWLCIADQKK